MPFKSYREESRLNYGTEDEGPMLDSGIQLGALLRIADSLEKMQRPFTDLLSERKRYEEYYRSGQKRERKLERQIAGLRGAITRMKNKS